MILALKNLNVLRMKMGRLKKVMSRKCYKILKFANFDNGGIDIQRNILRAMRKIFPTSLLLLVIFRDVITLDLAEN